MMQDSLPTRLRVLRAERGLTLREAATLTDVRPGTLSELERGVRHPHDVTLAKIADGYGVPVKELLEEPVPLGEAPEAGQSEGAQIQDDERQANMDRLAEACRDIYDEMKRVREAPAEELKAQRLAELGARLKETQAELAASVYRPGPPAGLTELGGKAIDRQRRQRAPRRPEDAGSEVG